jgi:hypothetical protein
LRTACRADDVELARTVARQLREVAAVLGAQNVRTNAIPVPSGDHCGSRSMPGSVVISTEPLPSVRIVRRSSFESRYER